MFRKNEVSLIQLPAEILVKITSELDLPDVLKLMSADRVLHQFMRDYQPYWSQFGASDYNDFSAQIQSIPAKYHNLVNSKIATLEDASTAHALLPSQIVVGNDSSVEEFNNIIQMMLKLAPVLNQYFQLITDFDRPEQMIKHNPHPNTDNIQFLFFENVVIAIAEGLIRADDVFNWSGSIFNIFMGCDNMLIALRERLIDSQSLANSPINQDVLQELLSDAGLLAMRDGKVTLEDAEQAASADALKKLIDVKNSESEIIKNTRMLMQGRRDEQAAINVLPVEMLEQIAALSTTSQSHEGSDAIALARRTRVAEQQVRMHPNDDDSAELPNGISRSRLR